MIKFDNYNDKLIGILGLAKSGKAAINSFIESNSQIVAWDDNEKILEQVKEEFSNQSKNLLFASPAEEKIWRRADAFLISPGIPMYYLTQHPLYKIAQGQGIPLYCDVEFLYQKVNKNVGFIGITGTNGKSTTTALINHVLRSVKIRTEIGGNIGTPVLELEELNSGFYVLEVSSFQLDLLEKTRFNIAVCLTITPDHLDKHGTFKRYAEAKQQMFNNQEKGDLAIISTDSYTNNQIMSEVIARKKAKVIPISRTEQIEGGVSVISGILYDNYKSKKQYNVSDISSLMGEHNGENMAAAFTACIGAGVKPEEIISAFKIYKSLPHRMDLFHRFNGINFINDSKATNADSTYWALKNFDNVYWIAGGICKDSGIKLLKPFFEKINHAYLIGDAAESFAAILAENNVPYTIATTLVNAVSIIKAQNIENGNVLLSPACASLDQWKNYEERGNAFMKLVKEKWPG